MVQLTDLAHQIVAEHIQSGDIAIDATCGNGHDTLFLAQCVGETGTVVASDIQSAAIDSTRSRCAEHKNVQYHAGDHAETLSALKGDYKDRVSVVMFNLGYLPGGEKSKTTSPTSTLAALDACLVLLKTSGLISVLAYIGHPGGEAEEAVVAARFDDWKKSGEIQVLHYPDDGLSSRSPRLYIGKKIV